MMHGSSGTLGIITELTFELFDAVAEGRTG